MKYISYVALLLLLVVVHAFLSGFVMITAWFLLGTLLALFFKGDRWLILKLLLLLWLTGAGFWFFDWNTGNQLNNLGRNTEISTVSWAGVIIGIQSITAFLCIVTSYSIVRYWRRIREHHP